MTGLASGLVLFLVKYRDATEKMATLGERIAEVNQPPSRILSADGKELFRVSEENRIPLKLSEIPKHVQLAVLAAEDKRFYQHEGVDAQALLRAVSTIFRDGRASQGGSTITMQLAKRLYTSPEKSLMRKVEDIALATAMEREIVNKNMILELYLNEVYFGQGAHGIGAAAKVYFNKTVDKLTISEAAMLARLVRLPSRQNPYKSPEIAERNRQVVLNVMREEKFITEAEYAEAIDDIPKVNPKPPTTSAFYPAGIAKHFVNHVLAYLERESIGIDVKKGGYTIYTTLDSELQKAAEKTVKSIVAKERGRRITEGAFVVMDKDGKILAEVGGTDFDKSQFNIISQGSLQPGSSFKPFVYATAVRDGVLGPDDMISNAPINRYDEGSRKMWSPKNFSRNSNAGAYPFKVALGNSINLPAIHTIERVGPKTVVDTAKASFGFHSKLDPVSPLALGATAVNPLELAEAYSVFMLGGDRVQPYPVTRVVSPDGANLHEFLPKRLPQVFDPRAAMVIDEALRYVVTSGTGRGALEVPNARGKTGTTNSAKDAWFCGYTDGLVGIGWVGNPQLVNGKWTRMPMGSNVTGGSVTVSIWREIMKVAHKKFGQKIENEVPRIAAGGEEDVPAIGTAREAVAVSRPPSIPSDLPTNRIPGEGEGFPTEVPPIDRAPRPTEPPVQRENPPTSDPKSAVPGIPPRGNADPLPAKRNDPPRRTTEDRTTQVEICADTGLRATMYCPETVPRSFPRGRAPQETCRLHG